MKQLLLFCLAGPVLAIAQTKPPIILKGLVAVTDQKVLVPFHCVQVWDVRFDKSNIGCLNRNISFNSFNYQKAAAVFPDSLHRHLPLLMQNFFAFDSSGKDTLMLLVKQFRITEHLFNAFHFAYEPELFLKVSLSAFRLRHGQLTKLFSVDGLFSELLRKDKKPRNDMMNDYRMEALTTLLKKLFGDKSWPTGGASFARLAVEEGIQKRFQLPLLNDTTLRYGIYKTFQDFKQNKPSVVNVRFTATRNGVIKDLTNTTGKAIEPKSVWGFCDGKKRYIMFRGELCELLSSDKSFCFQSYRRQSDLSSHPDFGSVALRSGILPGLFSLSDPANREYFYLNMDEEIVYTEEIFGKSGLKKMQAELLK